MYLNEEWSSLIKLIFGIVLTYFGIANGKLNAQSSKVANTKTVSELYARAPEVITGTLPEMRDPAYWIAKMKSPDEVMLSLEEILRKNEGYGQRIANLSGLDSVMAARICKEVDSRPGLLAPHPDIGSMSQAEVSALAGSLIDMEIGFLSKGHYGNIMGIEYSDRELKSIRNEMEGYNVPKRPVSRWGVTIADSRLAIVPSIRPEFKGVNSSGKPGVDRWNLDIVPIGSPVQVLCASRSGEFLLVLSEKGYGWIRSESVAMSPKELIDGFSTSGNFVVCTGDEVPFYSGPDCTIASGKFRMGDRLPLKNGDSTRTIQVPTRQTDGSLLVQNAWLRPDADVNVGYLPYTRKNVVVQAFKLLDNVYDYTGVWFGRNHATVLQAVFGCFGFTLPSNGVLMSAYQKGAVTISPDIGTDAQYRAILSNDPFLTIQISRSGHSQLYLGENRGVPIVFDSHGYSYIDENGIDVKVKRSVVGTVQLPDYFLKQEVTFIRLK